MIEIATQSANTSNWQSILENTKKVLTNRTLQEPYYQINCHNGSDPTPPAQPTNNTIYPHDSHLEALLSNLISKNRSLDARLAHVNNVLGYFTSDAQVITIGSDLKTIVDRESAKDFCTRICMSPNIVQINVVNETLGYEGKKRTSNWFRMRFPGAEDYTRNTLLQLKPGFGIRFYLKDLDVSPVLQAGINYNLYF